MNPPWWQAQQVLQRGKWHEHQSSVHGVKSGVKQPNYRVYVISRRAISRRRQQDDFGPHIDSKRGSEFISHDDIVRLLFRQVAPLDHPGLQHSDLLFLRRNATKKLGADRLMGRTDQAVSVRSGTRSLNLGVSGDGGNQRPDICPVSPSQSLLNGTVRVVARSMHLNIREKQSGAGLNHLLAQSGHQARNEHQHSVAQANRSHGNQRPPWIIPKIAPCEAQQSPGHCFRFFSENMSSLIGASNTRFS